MQLVSIQKQKQNKREQQQQHIQYNLPKEKTVLPEWLHTDK